MDEVDEAVCTMLGSLVLAVRVAPLNVLAIASAMPGVQLLPALGFVDTGKVEASAEAVAGLGPGTFSGFPYYVQTARSNRGHRWAAHRSCQPRTASVNRSRSSVAGL